MKSERRKIKVVILDDHQGIIDGYLYRLSEAPNIEVVATIHYGVDLEPTLAEHTAHVLILDIQVPVSPDNKNPYPILNVIPRVLSNYPGLAVLVISMHAQRTLIRAVLDAGASGYILKDDPTSIRELAAILNLVVDGGIHLSPAVFQAVMNSNGSDFTHQLNPRELEALTLCTAYPDESSAQIAHRMNIENSTVRNILSGAYLKLGVRTRAAAVAKAIQMELVTLGNLPGNVDLFSRED